MHVSDAGGPPEPLTSPAEGEFHRDPHFLPDGRTVLFVTERTGEPDRIAVTSLDAPEPRVLLAGNSPTFASSGHLVFLREDALWAVAFDVPRGAVVGDPAPVLEGTRGWYDIAANGTLIYSTGSSTEVPRTLVWVDRQGREEPIPAPLRAYAYPRVSPDGTQLALDIIGQNRDIWVWNFARRTLTRLTFDPATDGGPLWTPDGRRLIFTSGRAGALNLFWQAADGTGEPERLTDSPNSQFATAISSDGSRLVVRDGGAGTTSDLMLVPLQGARTAQRLIASMGAQDNGVIAPDGQWLAFESAISGRFEIYVRPFPNVDTGQWQVSTLGGTEPLWAPDGRELFYRALDGALMRVPIERDVAFRAGTPAQLVRSGYFAGGPGITQRTYDISPDGRRFVMIKEGNAAGRDDGPQLIVVMNWFEELNRRVPPK